MKKRKPCSSVGQNVWMLRLRLQHTETSRRFEPAHGNKETNNMEMTVRWHDGTEEPCIAIQSTVGLGIGALVSKVMVRRGGKSFFLPLHLADYVEIRSFGEVHRIRESQPVTVNMMQK